MAAIERGLPWLLVVLTTSSPALAQLLDAGARPLPLPVPNQGSPLVAEGENIPDLDQIVESLDRRTPVTSVAISPDGTLIASGAEDHQVRIWHLPTRRMVRRLAGHSSVVTAVAFSPDGSMIASASNDRTARLWDTRSGRLLRTLQGHVYHVYAVAFDPRGRLLATASWDRTIQLWDVRNGNLVKKLKGHEGPVNTIDFSPDGKLLASGSDDQTVRLWNVDDGSLAKVLTGHTGPVRAVRFRPDGESLFSGSSDQSVRLWRLPEGQGQRPFADCGAPVLSLAISPNGQLLAGGCATGGALLWDIPTATELGRLTGHTAETRAVAFSPDGRTVASGSADAAIIVYDVATLRPLASLSANLAHLEAAAYSPDGTLLATASRDGRVALWTLTNEHEVLGRVLLGAQGSLRTLAFAPDGKTLATGGEDGTVSIWEMDGGTEPRRLAGHQGPVNAVVFTPDGRTIASAGDDASVRLWDARKGVAGKVMKGHHGPVQALALSPDGSVLASASDDVTVRTWEVATGRSLAVLKSHREPVTSVAFSSDGKLLITGSHDRTVDVWLWAKQKLLKGMRKELASGVVALVAGVAGEHIAVAGADGSLSLWDLTGSRPVKQSTARADAVSALALAPDHGTLASASRDGMLREWDGKTLDPRWVLGGSTRERWFACNASRVCWRSEDGSLFGRVDDEGGIAAVPPSDDEHRTALAATADLGNLGPEVDVLEGSTATIPVRIDNRGAHPAYWIAVAQSARTGARTGGTSTVLFPPAVIPMLAPGASATVPCEVSALGDYEAPQPRSERLRLSISSASAEPLVLEIPVHVDVPYLDLRGLSLKHGPGDTVVASMSKVFMAGLRPVVLRGSLAIAGREDGGIAPITLEQPLDGQDLALSFPLPRMLRLDRATRVTFTVRKSSHPAHVWTFRQAAVHIPIPTWGWAALLAAALVLGLATWRLYPRARRLAGLAQRALRWARWFARAMGKALLALLLVRSTVRALRAHLQRRGMALFFFRLAPETQCSHLARQVGATWKPVGDGGQPVYELHFGPEVPLDLERCQLGLPASRDAVAAILPRLSAPEDESAITVIVSDMPRADMAEHLGTLANLVLITKPMMLGVLRAQHPALAFAQVVSAQLDRTVVSLYASATRGGRRQPFYGRKSELRRLAVDARRNHLLIGPQGIGKTSLLAEIARRLHAHPSVECHLLSLTNGDLTAPLADALGLPGETSLAVLLDHLGQRPAGKRTLILCDDADAWATRDGTAGGAELQSLTLLNQERPCTFVLAGFLGLLHAVNSLPGRKPFGDVLRLECLDPEACAELATQPMAALNLRYDKPEVLRSVVRQSGGMPSMLVAICAQIVERLPPSQHVIDQEVVDAACKSEPIARTITAWRPRFGLREPGLAMLDQTVMLAAVFKPRFTLHELQSTLAGLGVQLDATDIEKCADRLVAACVFEQRLGHFQFRVPLFQAVTQVAALAHVIEQ